MSEEKSYFDGGVLGWLGWHFLFVLIVVCTLGVCTPWAVCMLQGWKASHTVINGHRLKFSGKGINLFGNFIVWEILTIITLGIYGFWTAVNIEKWLVKNTSFDD